MHAAARYRIAALIPENLRRLGGSEVFAWNLLEAFFRSGHRVDLYLNRRAWRQDEASERVKEYDIDAVAGAYLRVYARLPGGSG